MIDHGFKTCVIDTLNFNATDIRRRMKEPHVVELAESIKKGVLMNPIMVNRKTKVLISGRDRLAAHQLLEKRSVWCHMVDADAKEVESLERAENLYRRQDDRDALIAAEQEALAATIEAEEKENPPEDAEEKKPGRKKTAKGKAREVMAKKLGTSKEAVRKAAERDAKKKKAAAEPKPTGIRADMAEIKGAIMGVVSPLTAAQKATTKLLTLAPVMGKGTEAALDRMRKELQERASELRLMRPAKVCSYCKGEKLDQGRDCHGCGGTGYLNEAAADVPASVEAAE